MENIINIYFKHHKMQIDMDSNIVKLVDDNNLSDFKFKAGDYISDDELYKLFSHGYRRVHSTSGNFYIYELAMGNKNKCNKRFVITDKMYFTIGDQRRLLVVIYIVQDLLLMISNYIFISK
jgi:hypothetical protein